MNLEQIVRLVAAISMGLIVSAITLQARPGDLTHLLRRPSLLLRSLLAMDVVMPLLAVAIAVLFNLRPQVEVALVLLAMAPVPPILPKKQSQAGGDSSYAIGLLMIAALVAIVTVPATIALIGRFFGFDVHVPATTIARTVAMSVVAPLLLGMGVRRLAPSFAARFAKPISVIGTALLLIVLIPILIKSWRGVVAQIGDFSIVAIVLFVLAGLAVGHLLGGPDDDDRTVLALSTASRHPGVALAIAGVIVPDQPSVPAAVLLAVLVTAVVTLLYVKIRQRRLVPAVAPVG